MKPYRVELEAFSGPMDLLLYLVKREEVAIEELPIAHITEQYLAYMEALEKVDVDQASEYLVMASMLLQIKARALLPEPPAEQDGEEESYTKDDLVKDLLEYRRLQEETRLLEGRRDEAQRRYGRTSERFVESIPLRDVDMWDLVTAFKLIEAEVRTKEANTQEVEADKEPVKAHIQRLRDLIASAAGAIRFVDLFEGVTSRAVLVSTFLALLELIRLAEVRAVQGGPFAEIHVVPLTAEERAERKAHDAIELPGAAPSLPVPPAASATDDL